MRKILSLRMAMLAAVPSVAQAAEPPCLTAAEFTALSTYSLPSIIAGTQQRCAATLGPNAWLSRNGAQLSQRYSSAKPAAWPRAKAAFIKLGSASGDNAINAVKSLPDDKLQPIADTLIEGMIGQQIPTNRCATIDRMVRLLAPLPPENTAELIALAAGLGSASGRGRVGSVSICPA